MKTKELFSRYPAKILFLKDLGFVLVLLATLENRPCFEIPSKISLLKDLVASGVPPLRGSVLLLLLPGTAVPGFHMPPLRG
jgi:hypothetical protein